MSSSKSLNKYNHSHIFDEVNPVAEANTRRVVILTLVMMAIEITGGWYYNSMALLADGWHMSSHAVALGLSAVAYSVARRLAGHSHFSFGTWKIEVLGGYTSAILLIGVAGLMVFQSIERLIHATPIHYDEAIVIAAVGLVVNLISAWMLKDGHHHHHDHAHDHEHDHHHHHHHDLNLRSAYLHVVADAATSVLAIVALFCGKWWGLDWMDPAMGVFGAVLIVVWAKGLVLDTSKILLDAEMNAPVVGEIQTVIQGLDIKAKITDLHVSRVANAKYACILSVDVEESVDPDYFKKHLAIHEELVHITVEVNRTYRTS